MVTFASGMAHQPLLLSFQLTPASPLGLAGFYQCNFVSVLHWLRLIENNIRFVQMLTLESVIYVALCLLNLANLPGELLI